MTRYIDDKYIRLISTQLKRFKHKSSNIYNFRCPFCGDSKKSETKARGYLFFSEDHYVFKCQNCGHSTGIGGLLKHVDDRLYRQFVLECFTNKKPIIYEEKSISIPKNESPTILLESIDGLPDDHYAVSYIRNRRIPGKFWSDIYFAPHFGDFVLSIKSDEDKGKYDTEPRIVIPIYDETKRLQGFQGRALSAAKAKYIAIKFSEDAIKLFGLERVDKTQKIYVLEGPIDSFFLPNAVATGDSDLLRSSKYLSQDQLVLIFDNEYHNKDMRKILSKAIDLNFQVCIFPKHVKEKDINEMIMNGKSSAEVQALVDANTFHGLRAKVELMNR